MPDDTLNNEVPILPEGEMLDELLNEPATTVIPDVPVIITPPPATSPVITAAVSAPAVPVVPTIPLVVPPVSIPLSVPIATSPAVENNNIKMGNRLSDAIEAGKHKVPEEPSPLVSKPVQLEPWRIFKIMAEFVDGFDLISKYEKGATFFGSDRSVLDPTVYQAATDLAGKLAKAGFAVITGGSEGIMEAANKGAYEAGGASVGLNIHLADNQLTNKYVTDRMMFQHFFVRKVMLTFSSEVYIYFPGGFGTLDEFTEILTLVQTKKIKRVPIVLYGKNYWTPILDLFKNHLGVQYRTIDPTDVDLYHLVDSVDEAYEYICKNVQAR